jgi:hypothetical protein
LIFAQQKYWLGYQGKKHSLIQLELNANILFFLPTFISCCKNCLPSATFHFKKLKKEEFLGRSSAAQKQKQ